MKEENQVIEPPDELDGAKVIRWAWSGNEPFGLLTAVDTDNFPSNID